MIAKSRVRPVLAMIAMLGALAFVAGGADARPAGGGSRGSRTFSAPPVTQTAPKTAAPIERTMTQPQRPATTAQAPGQTAPAQGGLFGGRFGGFGGGLLAGFLGAGLLGMLFGGGLFGGLSGGFASFLGLALQIALAVIVGRLAWSWWQRRQAGAYATARGPALRDMQADRPHAQSYGGGAAMAGGASMAGGAMASDNISIGEDDFNEFERKLGEIQIAYGAQDLGKLRALVTPEMLAYFSEDLAGNTSRGLVNEVSDVKLLQGDLAEAWNEDGRDYASVAMRYSLIDLMRERASGRIVEGSQTPQEVTEIWTFLRSRGGEWILSAIQES